ncbi:hypothetical protein HDU85_007537 [Gaertneriomyces sp. JEL0708]|nr:hypothetical protein HDU85_007537 [Gaertneriomyces sp. JEL0708]
MSAEEVEAQSAASATATATERKKAPTRPDQAAFEASLKQIDANIDALKKKLSASQDRIKGNGNGKENFGDRRKELRAKQEELQKERNEINDRRAKLVEQLKSLQAAIRKKDDEARNSKDRLGYKKPEDVDAQIALLERKQQSGQVSLAEEKRIIAEISNLKKARKILEGFANELTSLESSKAQIASIRTQLDAMDPERAAVRAKLDDIKAKLTELDTERKSQQGEFSDLINDHKSIKTELDAEYDKLRALKSGYKKQKDDWYAWQREAQSRKREQYQQRKREEQEARLQAQAEREREAAEIPAYSDEIFQCTNLISFLGTFVGETPKQAAEETATAPAAAAPLRQVPGIPEGAVMLKKKDDEDYLVLGGGKKSKKGRRQNGSGAGTPQLKPFKLDFDIIDQFVKLKIELPVSAQDVPATISALEEKKKWYKENQEEATAKAKAAAEAKIAALRRADTNVEQTADTATPENAEEQEQN